MATRTKAELEAYVAELEAKLAAKEAAEPKEEVKVEAPKAAPQPVYTTIPSTDVVVVYTSHSLGHMEGKMFSLDAGVYGEEFTLSRQQFDELVGKYRKWFNDGRLVVSYKNMDVAAQKGLPVDKNNGLSVEELHNLGNMSASQIEELWEKVALDSLRLTIVTYYKEKFLEGAPGYRDRTRIDCLNRLTDGGFDMESQTVGGRRVKIYSKDLLVEGDN